MGLRVRGARDASHRTTRWTSFSTSTSFSTPTSFSTTVSTSTTFSTSRRSVVTCSITVPSGRYSRPSDPSVAPSTSSPPAAASSAFSRAISSWNSRSIASFGSSLIFGLFLMFFARLA